MVRSSVDETDGRGAGAAADADVAVDAEAAAAANTDGVTRDSDARRVSRRPAIRRRPSEEGPGLPVTLCCCTQHDLRSLSDTWGKMRSGA